MIVITGSREVKTGVDALKNPIMKTVVETVDIPDEPKKLSDFPKRAIAATAPSAEFPDKVCVVTVDGKKFYVADDSTKAEKAAAAAATK